MTVCCLSILNFPIHTNLSRNNITILIRHTETDDYLNSSIARRIMHIARASHVKCLSFCASTPDTTITHAALFATCK